MTKLSLMTGRYGIVIELDDFLFKIGINQDYHHIDIDPNHQPYLKFFLNY